MREQKPCLRVTLNLPLNIVVIQAFLMEHLTI